MADPVVHITAGIPDSGTGNITTLGQTLLDGANATHGITTGAAVTTDVAGTFQQYLRGLVKLWTTVTFKAASTAAAATDPALVVAISPNGQNANGSATDANSTPVAWSTEGKAQLGSLTETAPATDTASSGQNGRLQRIAQRITSLIALFPTSLGTQVAASSFPVALASDGIATVALSKFSTGKYVTVAASQTATVLQASAGATGDYISGILVIPATTSPGNVLLLDNATSITVFTGGATSVSNLVPFFIPLGAVSASGAWKITTGANVSVIAIGKFS